jgi:hypothetical protein
MLLSCVLNKILKNKFSGVPFTHESLIFKDLIISKPVLRFSELSFSELLSNSWKWQFQKHISVFWYLSDWQVKWNNEKLNNFLRGCLASAQNLPHHKNISASYFCHQQFSDLSLLHFTPKWMHMDSIKIYLVLSWYIFP